ncbi:MAG: tetratricopeptide repeat protein [Streptosporangiaceae bacterium]
MLLGPEHPLTLQSGHLLALSLYRLGRHKDARTVIRGVASSQYSLACARQGTGQTRKAQPVIEAAANTRTAELGTDHPDTADAQPLLAQVLWSLGKQGRAAEAALLAVQTREALLGPDAAETQEANELLTSILNK